MVWLRRWIGYEVMTGFRNLMMGAAGAAGAGGYEVANSGMFNDGDNEYLTKTFSGAPTNQKKFTVSGWYKRCDLSVGDHLFGGVGASATTGRVQVYWDAADKLVYEIYHGSGWNTVKTTQVFRDPHAWYNIMIVYDVDNSTSLDKMRVYLNGSRITTFDTHNPPSSSLNHLMFSNSHPTMIGNSGDNAYFDGYIAEVVGLDGVALTDMSTVGGTDDNGVWRPVNPTAGNTFSNNSFYLNFASSGADLGDDASGNSNDFTNTNSVTQTTDSPTTNFATLSPLQTRTSVTLSNGNLKRSGGTSSQYSMSLSSIAIPPTGKWGMKFTLDAGSTAGVDAGNQFLGVITQDFGMDVVNSQAYPSGFANYVSGRLGYGEYVKNGVDQGGTTTFATGDSGEVLVDQDNQTVTFTKTDGTVVVTISSVTTAPTHFFIAHYDTNYATTVDFGQNGYTPFNTAYKPLSAANMYEESAPAIEDGTAHFQASLWSGNSSSQTVNQSGNSNFTPDKVWIKDRNFGNIGNIFDAVRGSNKGLALDTGTEDTNANGVTLGSGSIAFTGAGDTGDINTSGRTYVGWQWKGGNGTSTPSGGSVSSTVSVNQTAGFSIVSWTGTGANATVAHGLGATPQVVWVRNRSVAGGWYVGHASAGFNYEVRLDEDGARAGSATLFNETAPTSTVFTVGTAAGTNGSTNNMIAYCWAEKPGFSKFDSFVGTANADGPFIELGFKPAFFLTRPIGTASDWSIFDNGRSPENVMNASLAPNTSAADYTHSSAKMDFLSNGVKIRGTFAPINSSGQTIIYMAFAEHPFAATTPATAR